MALHTPIDRADLSESLTRIAGLLLSEEKLEAVLELVTSLTARTLRNADGVSVTLVRDGRFTTAVYSNEMTRRVDSWQYATGEGPCLRAATDGEIQTSCDLAKSTEWPAFAEMAIEEGVHSILAVPFRPKGQPIGTLNIYSTEREAFGGSDVEIASMFAEQAAIVIANSMAYSSAVDTNSQLKEAIESRDLIGQAKGVLMEREGCSADQAFVILKEVSHRTNRKLRQVAQDVLNSVHPRMSDSRPG